MAHEVAPAAQAAALIRVRALLLELGCTDAEIQQAVDDDVIDLLVVDRLLLPTAGRMTEAEISARTGMPVEETRRFWRALGFTDVDEDAPEFTEMDVEAAQLFQSMVALGVVDLDWAVQMARVIGTSMARIAEAETGPTTSGILLSSGDSIVDADRFAAGAGASIPAMARLLEYVWRRHLQAATRRAMLARARGQGERISQALVVGFADMVGFTALSQHLDDGSLAAVVARFEELAHDTVVARGGRVVKMIGDEVMFVVEDVAEAAEIGVGLAEAYAGDDLLSDVRVALAVGDVLMQEGDYYGPVVNLASRLVGIAHPGTVLVSDEFRTGLVRAGATRFATRPIRTRVIKDIGRVQVWKLTRAGTEPGADRHRNVRWERLGEVLRELEDLRDRGERLVLQGTVAEDTVADGAVPGEVAAGDGAGPTPSPGRGHGAVRERSEDAVDGDGRDDDREVELKADGNADGKADDRPDPTHEQLAAEWGFGE